MKKSNKKTILNNLDPSKIDPNKINMEDIQKLLDEATNIMKDLNDIDYSNLDNKEIRKNEKILKNIEKKSEKLQNNATKDFSNFIKKDLDTEK